MAAAGAQAPTGLAPHRRTARPVTGWEYAFRELEFWLMRYRRTWRSSVYSSALSPLLYLGAMGLGLGSLIDKHGTAGLGGVSYLAFLAPGLLAAIGMQTAVGESTYPVFGSIKWNKNYQAAIASPLRPRDVLHGHLMFVTIRLVMNTTIFLAVAAAFGAVRSPLALAAVPVAVLTGLAFAPGLEAWSVTRKNESSFAMIFRFGLIPLFLFSGTFFPVTQLPVWLRPVAYVSPLWHGVTLCRDLALGTATWGGALVHVAYLVALAAGGLVLGRRAYTRRLHV